MRNKHPFGVVLLFVMLSLAVSFTCYFVIRPPPEAVARGYGVFGTVSSVVKASDVLLSVHVEAEPYRSSAEQLTDLASQFNLNSSNSRAQITNIAAALKRANQRNDASWKEFEVQRAVLSSLSRRLEVEADGLNKTISELRAEELRSKSKLLSDLLWFILSCFGLFLLFLTPNLGETIRFIVGFTRGVKVPGLEISFAEPDAKSRNIDIRSWFSDAFRELREQARAELKLFVEQRDVQRVFENAAKNIEDHLRSCAEKQTDVVPGAGPPEKWIDGQTSLRCTLHVPDAVFKDFLCQLTEYYPIRKRGGAPGRAWPICYGMIGRVWRSNKSELRCFSTGVTTLLRDSLTDEYAMTHQQATDAFGGSKSYLCILLRDGATPRGVLYFDSQQPGVFGKPQDAVTRWENPGVLEKHCSELVDRLNSYAQDIYRLAAPIEIIDVNER